MTRCISALLAIVFLATSAVANTPGRPLPEITDLGSVPGVFPVFTITVDSMILKVVGTGFILDSSGVGLTNSHVVRHTLQHPDRFRMITVIEEKWYGLVIVCAVPRLSDGYMDDAAVIRIVPAFTDKPWGWHFKNGTEYLYEPGTALPELPAFKLAAHSPGIGSRVVVPGFSHISALPRIFVVQGTVADTFSQDGVTVLQYQSENPNVAGSSGSPVLNQNGEVVGIHAWSTEDKRVKEGVSVESFRDIQQSQRCARP